MYWDVTGWVRGGGARRSGRSRSRAGTRGARTPSTRSTTPYFGTPHLESSTALVATVYLQANAATQRARSGQGKQSDRGRVSYLSMPRKMPFSSRLRAVHPSFTAVHSLQSHVWEGE